MAQGRVSDRDIKELVSLVGGLVKSLAPEELRPNLKVTNASSRYKFLLRASFDGGVFFVAETKATEFKIAAAYESVSMPHGATKDVREAVKKYVQGVLEERYARMAANWNLNAPLRGIAGVRASQCDDGLVHLEFEALTPQAYHRMVKVLVPLMHVVRYDREEPL